MSLDPQTGLEPGKQEIEHFKTTGMFTTRLVEQRSPGGWREPESHFDPSGGFPFFTPILYPNPAAIYAYPPAH